MIGNVLGGVFAQVAYFDGLAYLTILLAVVAMGAIATLLVTTHRRLRHAEPVRP